MPHQFGEDDAEDRHADDADEHHVVLEQGPGVEDQMAEAVGRRDLLGRDDDQDGHARGDPGADQDRGQRGGQQDVPEHLPGRGAEDLTGVAVTEGTASTAAIVEIQTKKKTVAATRAICGPSPRPNMLRKTGSRASFGTTYRASSNGSRAARTSGERAHQQAQRVSGDGADRIAGRGPA